MRHREGEAGSWESAPSHAPVLLEQVLKWLAPRPGGFFADVTVGYGGHARAILERSAPSGRLLALDRDAEALAAVRAELDEFGSRVEFVHAPFSQLEQIARGLRGHAGVALGTVDGPDGAGFAGFDGILADFGVSSPQLDRGERGFSFIHDGPLDMRMDPRAGQSAADLVANLDEAGLANLIFRYGEERKSRRIARAICQARAKSPITTTRRLAEVVASAVGDGRRRIHPATRTFQALRMAVNDELGEIAALCEQVPRLLRPGGRFVAISFHSLEDRLVKKALRAHACIDRPRGPGEGLVVRPGGTGAQGETPLAGPRLRILTRKVVTADPGELNRNPRARSAKLRVAERVCYDGESS